MEDVDIINGDSGAIRITRVCSTMKRIKYTKDWHAGVERSVLCEAGGKIAVSIKISLRVRETVY